MDDQRKKTEKGKGKEGDDQLLDNKTERGKENEVSVSFKVHSEETVDRGTAEGGNAAVIEESFSGKTKGTVTPMGEYEGLTEEEISDIELEMKKMEGAFHDDILVDYKRLICLMINGTQGQFKGICSTIFPGCYGEDRIELLIPLMRSAIRFNSACGLRFIIKGSIHSVIKEIPLFEKDGRTTLHIAVEEGNLKSVGILLTLPGAASVQSRNSLEYPLEQH